MTPADPDDTLFGASGPPPPPSPPAGNGSRKPSGAQRRKAAKAEAVAAQDAAKLQAQRREQSIADWGMTLFEGLDMAHKAAGLPIPPENTARFAGALTRAFAATWPGLFDGTGPWGQAVAAGIVCYAPVVKMVMFQAASAPPEPQDVTPPAPSSPFAPSSTVAQEGATD